MTGTSRLTLRSGVAARVIAAKELRQKLMNFLERVS
jgi:hypothetical protein